MNSLFTFYSGAKVTDFAVTIISTSTNGPNEECFIQDLLIQRASDNCSPISIIIVNNETFLLHIVQVLETSSATVEGAISTFSEFLSSHRSSSASTFYKIERRPLDATRKTDDASITCLATLSRAHGSFFDSLSLPKTESEHLRSHKGLLQRSGFLNTIQSSTNSAGRYLEQYVSVRLLFWSILAVLSLILIVSFAPKSPKVFVPHLENGKWAAYDTTFSQGPRYELHLEKHNASSWTSQHMNDHEWVLRLDDQALIPANLVDESEASKQRWFHKRYPRANEVRLSKDYTKKSFLSDDSQIKIPTDLRFHMAHCVLALRRYSKAMETGRHVCPEELDHAHARHCLNSLDSWIFVDGERGTMNEPPDDGTWDFMRWETKVCF